MWNPREYSGAPTRLDGLGEVLLDPAAACGAWPVGVAASAALAPIPHSAVAASTTPAALVTMFMMVLPFGVVDPGLPAPAGTCPRHLRDSAEPRPTPSGNRATYRVKSRSLDRGTA